LRVAIELWSGIEGKMLRVKSRTQLGITEMYRRRGRVKELQGTKIYWKKEENNLDWTRLEAVEVLLNVHQGLSWGAGSHINSGPYLQGQKAVLALGEGGFFSFLRCQF
jgi:hypothetical protein